jgi:hypothetical protein
MLVRDRSTVPNEKVFKETLRASPDIILEKNLPVGTSYFFCYRNSLGAATPIFNVAGCSSKQKQNYAGSEMRRPL